MRMPNLLPERIPALAGCAALALALLAALLLPQSAQELLRDNALDIVLRVDQALRPLEQSELPVVVVDIDRRSIEALGPWQWPREMMARVVEAIAMRHPKALAIDVLFAEADDRSPAALARRLGALTRNTQISALADSLPDGDRRLADALKSTHAVLGFVLDPDLPTAPIGAPIATRGRLPFDDLWRAMGAAAPPAPLAEAGSGIGALSLPAGADGAIRQVPLFVAAGGAVLPGLAVDAARVARGAASFLIQSAPPALTIGDQSLALPPDGLLRLLPRAAQRHDARALSAVDVVEGKADADRLTGALVLLGGSAPELGGLRKTPSDAFVPSVQIQADAIEQILAGRVPRLLAASTVPRTLIVLLVGILAIGAGARLSPMVGAAVVLGVVVAFWAASSIALLLADRLLDPLTPSLAVGLVAATASVTAASVTRRREALVRRRLEQHLAPAVVQRIVAEPALLKLRGERREVTALFTDIEGFVETTHATEPEVLIATLDRYFEGVAALIIGHGGMIDKIVGDGVHALFNVPIDLDQHARRAVDCAIAIRAWTEAFRADAIKLGATRIGIETGDAIVGDVGIRSKLDYTAHGDAVNLAARLQALNKQIGSLICIGPSAAAHCGEALVRPLGVTAVAGREEPVAVFEPWPSDAPPVWHEAYLAAYRVIARDPLEAAALFDKLAAERPADPALRLMARRISDSIMGSRRP
jgi:adenylate cyclase